MVSIDDTLDSIADDFGYNAEDWNIDAQEYALALIMIMDEFVRKYESKSLASVKRSYVKDIDRLEDKLLKTHDKYYDKMIENYLKTRANKYKIPSSKVGSIPESGSFDYNSTKNVIVTTIKNTIITLKNSIKEVIQVIDDTANDININGKLKEAVKRINGAVEYGSRIGGEKANRTVEEFVYGDNARFKWVTRGDSRVCEWCIMQEGMPPRPLKDMPFDHANGRCTVEPADDVTSEAYNELLGL